jgi:hypothetical protein
MRMRLDIPVAAIIVATCAWGVIWQFSDNAPPPEAAAQIEPLRMGEVLEVDFTLQDLDALPKPRNLMAWYGERATVLYTWSVPCPCIEDVEPRLRRLHERYNRERNGVRWVALAGEPDDTREEIQAKRDRMGAFYPLLHDPEQLVCRRLGLVHAGQVAVLDGAGRLVYRGSVDGDYAEGQAEYLEEALAALLAGTPVAVPERARAYGCAFSIPLSCRTLEEGADEVAR